MLIDHRPGGGFYGNNLAAFHGLPFAIDAVRDDDGKLIDLKPDDSPKGLAFVAPRRKLLTYATSAEQFLKVWQFGDWNTLKIRSVGEYPLLTTWVNGLKIAELDTGKMEWPNYDRDAALQLLGRTGHIALEIHNNHPDDPLGQKHWWPGAVLDPVVFGRLVTAISTGK